MGVNVLVGVDEGVNVAVNVGVRDGVAVAVFVGVGVKDNAAIANCACKVRAALVEITLGFSGGAGV